MLRSRRRPRCVQLDLFHLPRKALVLQQLPQEAKAKTMRLLAQLLRSHHRADLDRKDGEEACHE